MNLRGAPARDCGGREPPIIVDGCRVQNRLYKLFHIGFKRLIEKQQDQEAADQHVKRHERLMHTEFACGDTALKILAEQCHCLLPKGYDLGQYHGPRREKFAYKHPDDEAFLGQELGKALRKEQ